MMYPRVSTTTPCSSFLVSARRGTIDIYASDITLPRSSSFSTVPATNASAVTAAADNDSAGILPPPTTNVGRPAASNIDPGSAV